VNCPFCLEPDTRVQDSRARQDAPIVWRRRVCSRCNPDPWTTYELCLNRPLIHASSALGLDLEASLTTIRPLEFVIGKKI
jgi:hypothetical protein